MNKHINSNLILVPQMRIAIFNIGVYLLNMVDLKHLLKAISRLVENGYEITVSCEYQPLNSQINEFNGVKLEYFPLKAPKSYLLRMFYENLSDIYFLIKLTRNHDLIYF